MNPGWANRPYWANLPYIYALPSMYRETSIPGGIYRGRLGRSARSAQLGTEGER